MEGNNARFTLIRESASTDDSIGGANITGTVIVRDIPGRLAQSPISETLLQQGIEVNELFRAQFKSLAVNIKVQDILQLTYPSNHSLLNQYFRVISVRLPSFWDNRKFQQVMLSRIVYSRSQQF